LHNTLLRKIILYCFFFYFHVKYHAKNLGEPSCQKTIALEKASILFNIAALYTQIGAKKDRTKSDELDNAVDCFLKAAGIFQHITGMLKIFFFCCFDAEMRKVTIFLKTQRCC
jgi:BRO1-like domain